MAAEIIGNPSGVKLQVQTGGAGLVSTREPYIGSNGAYRLCEETGLITGIAAGTTSAGFLFAFRWTHATKLALITSFRASWRTIAGFTAAQEVGMQLFRATTYTASSSGGTAITLTGENLRKRATHGTTTVADARISTTGALTAGTLTLDTHKLAAGSFAELAAGAAVPKGFFEIQFKPADVGWEHPLVLSQNTGLILRNSILMGAGGTARVAVEMDWLEVDSY
jgi:hypothetical protein